jgi:DNA-binding NarL/FixJ family response regulator
VLIPISAGASFHIAASSLCKPSAYLSFEQSGVCLMVFAPPRVIVFDVSRLQSELLVAALESLQRGFEIRSANDLESLTTLLGGGCEWVVVLSDNSISSNAIPVARQLRSRFHTVSFVFIVREGRSDRVIEAFKTGARGIVYSNESLPELADCISRVACGELSVRGTDLGLILDGLLKPNSRVTDAAGRALLSPREEEISRLVADGLSNREVARTLSISESTVKNSLFHVFEKLGISNRVELARYVNSAAEQTGPALQ